MEVNGGVRGGFNAPYLHPFVQTHMFISIIYGSILLMSRVDVYED